MKIITKIMLFNVLLSCSVSCFPQALHPAGDEKKISTKTLDTASKIVQNHAPLQGFNLFLVAFHPMKNDPSRQMTAYHYCKQMNEDFAQCLIFDSDKPMANLVGVEYIISQKIFNTLPNEEKQYWHPHNYEILSGQLIAPLVPHAVEKHLLKQKINSYGKTWHFWMTNEGDKLPIGPAMLAWSFNHDGEVNPQLVQQRDKYYHVNTDELRQKRQSLAKYAEPQTGTDALNYQYQQLQTK